MEIISKKVIELKETLDNIADDCSVPQEKRIQRIIHATSLTCAIVAIQPFPFADLFVLTYESFHVAGSYNFLLFGGDVDEHTRDEGTHYSENVEEIRIFRNTYFNF